MNLRLRINLGLKYLENDKEIVTSSGHTIVWSPDYDDIGFLVQKHMIGSQVQETEIHQIGSTTVWAYFLAHMKQMSETELMELTLVPKLKNGKVTLGYK